MWAVWSVMGRPIAVLAREMHAGLVESRLPAWLAYQEHAHPELT